MTWRVLEVVCRERGDDRFTTGAIRERLRLRVYGQLPYGFDDGYFVMGATTYVGKPHWWIRPEESGVTS